MKTALCLRSLTALALLAAGCSSSDDPAEKTGPVAASPLTGTVEGKAFVAKSAIAKSGFDAGERMIDIYDTDVKCSDFAPKADRSVLISVPWTAGTVKDFSFGTGPDGQTATFVIKTDSKTNNVISTQGRVEIVEAPAEPGATGKIRLRAVAQEHNVEGEIAVEVCD